MDAEWTFMVYMAGYNNLSEAAGVDLGEMRTVGSSDRVRVLSFLKQLPDREAFHIEVARNGEDEHRESLGDKDSGDPQTVLDFIRWATRRAPAKRYALVLWNHGSGWVPQDFDALYAQARNAPPGDADKREFSVRANQLIARAMFTTTLERFVSLDPEDRAICSDDGTGHSLDTLELGDLLEDATEEMGAKLDLLGMDACLMSNLEVTYQVRARAATVVGSEELEPNAGWPYETILGDLTAQPDMEGGDLGKLVVERYIDSYRDSDREWPVTQCAVAAAQVDDFSRSLDRFATALHDQVALDYRPILRAQMRSTRFEMQLRDLKTFCDGLRDSSAEAPVKEAAGELLTAMKPGTYVLAEGHLGGKVADCGGITVYFPSPAEPVSRYYRDLRFARTHGWDEFLRAYGDAVRGG